MSTITTHKHTLELDPETGLFGLAGVTYSHLSWREAAILEDLLIDAFGAAVESLEAEVLDALPPF